MTTTSPRIDRARDARITALAARTTQRCDAAVAFLLRLLFALALALAGVWAVLTYLEPCAAATLCTGVPLIRQPHLSTAPRWWQRLVLRWRLLRLQARRSAIEQDAQFLQHELVITRNMLDACHAEADEAASEIAWARSDLAKLEVTR
jgi:hypothetical protein